jgi:hypothetical protein
MKMIKIVISVCVIIILGMTNPNKLDFIFFANNYVKKQYPELQFTQTEEPEEKVMNLFKGIAKIVITNVVDSATTFDNYYLFTIYTVDTSLLQLMSKEQKNLKFLGVAGQFIPINSTN